MMNIQRMDEITYEQFRSKQQQINRLRPKHRERVQAVGKPVLYNVTEDTWQFKVPSGTKKGVKYDVYLQFLDLPDLIAKYGRLPRFQKKNKIEVNASLLAEQIYQKADLRLGCSCQDDLYGGFKYIRTQKDANYGDDEDRAPVKRNPREKGIECKHCDKVMARLPFLSRSTLANYLLEYYSDDIKKISTDAQFKQELKQKQGRISEPQGQ